jgi:hypothetical protein
MTEPIALTDQEKEDLAPHVKALIDTVALNMFVDTISAIAREWGIMDNWPSMPDVDTVMRDGTGGAEKDFTKRYCKCYEVGTAHGVATRFECINGQSKTMPIRMSKAIGAGLKCPCGNSVAR